MKMKNTAAVGITVAAAAALATVGVIAGQVNGSSDSANGRLPVASLAQDSSSDVVNPIPVAAPIIASTADDAQTTAPAPAAAPVPWWTSPTPRWSAAVATQPAAPTSTGGSSTAPGSGTTGSGSATPGTTDPVTPIISVPTTPADPTTTPTDPTDPVTTPPVTTDPGPTTPPADSDPVGDVLDTVVGVLGLDG